jgi:hypothetical protein
MSWRPWKVARLDLPPYGYLYATTAPLTRLRGALGTLAKLTSVTETTGHANPRRLRPHTSTLRLATRSVKASMNSQYKKNPKKITAKIIQFAGEMAQTLLGKRLFYAISGSLLRNRFVSPLWIRQTDT